MWSLLTYFGSPAIYAVNWDFFFCLGTLPPRSQAFVSSGLLLFNGSPENHLLVKMALNPAVMSQLLSDLTFLWHLAKRFLFVMFCLFLLLLFFMSCRVNILPDSSVTCVPHQFLISWSSGDGTYFLAEFARQNMHFSLKAFLVRAPTILLGPQTHLLHQLLHIRVF